MTGSGSGSGQYVMLLVLVSACISSISSAADGFDDSSSNNGVAPAQAPTGPHRALPVITFINHLAPLQSVEVMGSKRVNNSVPATVLDTVIQVNAEYEWHITENRPFVDDGCVVIRPDFYKARFDCYWPSRDYGRKKVYWLMDEEGIHLSWDKSKWSMYADWTYSE